MTLARWIAPTLLAAALGTAAGFAPAPAQAQDALSRVLVDIADVVFRSGTPYYRYGDYGSNDRLVAGRDRYGRTVYYRVADPRYGAGYGQAGRPPYGNAYGDYRNRPGSLGNGQRSKCNKHGKCKVEYYDARYDRRQDPRYGGYYGDRRWDRDDD